MSRGAASFRSVAGSLFACCFLEAEQPRDSPPFLGRMHTFLDNQTLKVNSGRMI
jgi:hypothetical protein